MTAQKAGGSPRNSPCPNGPLLSDWVKAGDTHATAQQMLVKNFVEGDHAVRLLVTDQRRSAPSELVSLVWDRADGRE